MLSHVIILIAAGYSIPWLYYKFISWSPSGVLTGMMWYITHHQASVLTEGTHTIFICWKIIERCQFFPPAVLLMCPAHLFAFVIFEGRWIQVKHIHKPARENQKARGQSLLRTIKGKEYSFVHCLSVLPILIYANIDISFTCCFVFLNMGVSGLRVTL